MRWFGKIGFAELVETTPGVWEDQIVIREYYGDVIRNTRRYQQGKELNDNLTISNSFSIVADAYAYNNFHTMKYIEWMGAKWKVSSVIVEHPRLILEVSEVYNGDEGPETSAP